MDTTPETAAQVHADWAHDYYTRSHVYTTPYAQLLEAEALCAQIAAEHLNGGRDTSAREFAQAYQLLKERREGVYTALVAQDQAAREVAA